MEPVLQRLVDGLSEVRTSREYQKWVRVHLRKVLPHASFLATLGNLYNTGSVGTHRIAVNFPLTLVEELKNKSGAIDDPVTSGWFKTERAKHFFLGEKLDQGGRPRWKKVLVGFGVQSLLVHGVLDHSRRRFALFQIVNCHESRKGEARGLLDSIVHPMADAAWMTVDSLEPASYRDAFGHPTLSLTATELEIVEYLSQGLSNKEIAKRRGVSDSTVKTQIARTASKLGASRRAEVVAIALPVLSGMPAQGMVDYDDDRLNENPDSTG